MELWHAIVLGAVEGITEFLPISSTGHLMLVSHLLRLGEGDFIKSFEIVIQLGAILAVVLLYPRRLFLDRQIILRVIVGFLPTAILGLLFYKIIKLYLLGNTTVVLAALFVGGIVIICFERFVKISGEKSIADLTFRDAAMIGTIQSISFVPGVSRAAATIFGGMWIGLSRKEAVEFSFLLAVPTMAAATGLDVLKNYELMLSGGNFLFLAVGFIVAFLTALAGIKLLVRFVSTHDFTLFGIYRIVIALLFFALFF